MCRRGCCIPRKMHFFCALRQKHAASSVSFQLITRSNVCAEEPKRKRSYSERNKHSKILATTEPPKTSRCAFCVCVSREKERSHAGGRRELKIFHKSPPKRHRTHRQQAAQTFHFWGPLILHIRAVPCRRPTPLGVCCVCASGHTQLLCCSSTHTGCFIACIGNIGRYNMNS